MGKHKKKKELQHTNIHTFRSMSSFLNLDTLSTKREKFLQQNYMRKRTSSKSGEYKKNYSHCQEKPLVDDLQEKYSLSTPSLDAWKHEHEYFS
jgi:hypothetical protein